MTGSYQQESEPQTGAASERRTLLTIGERFVREVAPTRHEISYSAMPAGDIQVLRKRTALRALLAVRAGRGDRPADIGLTVDVDPQNLL